MLSALKELADAVLAELGTIPEAAVCQRKRAILAVIEYCTVEGGEWYHFQHILLGSRVVEFDKKQPRYWSIKRRGH
jgi:hypothetical protein